MMILLYMPPATLHKHLFGNTNGLDIQQWKNVCRLRGEGLLGKPHAARLISACKPEMALGEYIIAYQFPKRIIEYY